MKKRFSFGMSSPAPIIMMAALLIASLACGSSASVSTEAPTSGKETIEPVSPPATDIPQQSSQTPVFCEVPAPVELGLGQTLDGMIDDPTWEKCFWVLIPEGLSRVSFSLGGLSDDLNLAVGYGFPVTLQYHIGEFYRPGEKGTTDELVVIDDPAPGPYYIKVGIADPRNPSTFSLAVHSEPEMTTPATGQALPLPDTCAFPAVEVEIGSTVLSEITGRDNAPLTRRYFCVQVPDGTDSLTIKLTELQENLDLQVRLSVPSEWMDISRGGSERIVVIENPQSGSYYIDVVGAYPGAGSAFRLSVSSP